MAPRTGSSNSPGVRFVQTVTDNPDARDRDWMRNAACRHTATPDIWFPPSRGQTPETVRAKRICRDCPVQTRCNDYADALDIPFGIWGNRRRGRDDTHPERHTTR